MTKPITKLAIQITSPADVENALHEGFFEANRGRPGPILIDIPDDIQRTSFYFERKVPYEASVLSSFNYIEYYARNSATPNHLHCKQIYYSHFLMSSSYFKYNYINYESTKNG